MLSDWLICFFISYKECCLRQKKQSYLFNSPDLTFDFFLQFVVILFVQIKAKNKLKTMNLIFTFVKSKLSKTNLYCLKLINLELIL